MGGQIAQDTVPNMAHTLSSNRDWGKSWIYTDCAGDVIQWPPKCDLARLAGKWAARAGFPGVVGAIDGTYIKIPGTRDAYICRKGFPAMHLQVVCDKDLLFLDVFMGYTGSVHDSRVFPNSDLHGVLESDASKLPPEYHMIGDSAYPQSPQVPAGSIPRQRPSDPCGNCLQQSPGKDKS
ncbi:uncharacterized protein [Littorina saxatilis]|uniref:uncharacterized protein n=1 Tax=Littorina saxatilis TaxID=31220 RepID=UPI0038B66687